MLDVVNFITWKTHIKSKIGTNQKIKEVVYCLASKRIWMIRRYIISHEAKEI